MRRARKVVSTSSPTASTDIRSKPGTLRCTWWRRPLPAVKPAAAALQPGRRLHEGVAGAAVLDSANLKRLCPAALRLTASGEAKPRWEPAQHPGSVEKWDAGQDDADGDNRHPPNLR